MWNPFTHREQPPSGPEPSFAASDEGHVHAPRRSSIADVELMGNVAVATLTVTELAQEDGADELAGLLDEMSQTGALHFVLDVQNVQYMDTTCIGCLVEAINTMAGRGGRIALANPNHSVHYVFRLTRLDRVFSICSDVMAALAAVEGKPEE